ncbi:MAG: hypothetical protein QOF69_4103, partial [Solirubrobacteraceae bacterium]|nr:hypothetical protein [Solirubrobacteraceae bacterium]
VGRVKQSGYSGGTPLILHWDGSGWQTVPPPSGVTGELRAVSRDGAGGAWAVGDDGHGHPVALRCTLVACAPVNVPQSGTVGRLRGIKAFAENDVWAVGESDNRTLIVHWDGADWSVVGSPNPDSNVNILHAVGGVAGDDLWAVGRMGRNKADTGVPPGTRTLAMHWDGQAWTAVSTPNVGDNDILTGVAAQGPTAATTVGSWEDVSSEIPVARTLAERWDGSSWATLSTPNVGATDNLLRAIAPIPGTADVWAVGMHLTTRGPTQTLVLRDSGDPTGGGGSPPADEPAQQTDPAAQSGPAPQRIACGPVRVNVTLGRAGLRAKRIMVDAGGKRQVLRGPRRRLKVTVPYRGAPRARLTIRIRHRSGKLSTIRRTVKLCRLSF